MKEFDVVIVGGGASGCFCALALQKKLRVAIVDPNLFLAKKLLVTGNGKCNLTNLITKDKSYNQNLTCFFERFNCNNTIEFFDSLGLKTYADEEGRVYPVSNSAKSVVEIIDFHLNKNKNLNFINGSVVKITQENHKYKIETENQTILCNKVVIATGGNTAKNILNNFNIAFKQSYPSLVALKTKQISNRLDGLRVSNVKVCCITKNNKHSEFGEVLFKKNGLSGICVFNLSCFFAREGCFNGKVYINLLPQYTDQKLYNILKQNFNMFNTAQNAVIALLHKQLAIEVLYRSNIDIQASCNQITDKQLKTLTNNILNLEFDVVDYFDNNQVYSGGVDLKQLDNNLQSSNYNNMYFCGEVCDVDGLCGGYNLQWAWTSAFIVAKAIEGEQ